MANGRTVCCLLPPVDRRWQVTQGIVRVVLVVGDAPAVQDLTDLVAVVEQIKIEDLIANIVVEPFDEGVLVGLVRLNVDNLDAMGIDPGDERLDQELWPIVDPDAL